MQNRKPINPYLRLLLWLTVVSTLLLWPGGFQAMSDPSTPVHSTAFSDASTLLPTLVIGGVWTLVAVAFGWLGHAHVRVARSRRGIFTVSFFALLCGLAFLLEGLGAPFSTLDLQLRMLAAALGTGVLVVLPELTTRLRHLLDAEQQLGQHTQNLQEARKDLQQQQQTLLQARKELTDLQGWAEFHATLWELLHTPQDPDTVVEHALAHLGAALDAEQISAIRIDEGRARLWHAWGDFQPHALAFLMGAGTPVSELVLLKKVVEQGTPYYTDHYQQEAGARPVSSRSITAAFEPIKNASGQVVAVLAFSREEERPWDDRVKELARKAAATLALVLERSQKVQD